MLDFRENAVCLGFLVEGGCFGLGFFVVVVFLVCGFCSALVWVFYSSLELVMLWRFLP